MAEPAADVAIIGAGVIGCATAWELARRGLRVEVVERGSPGGGASWAAGGMLSPLAEAEQPGPFLELGLASLAAYPAFVERLREATGQDVGYEQAGMLQLALDEPAADALAAQRRWLERAGHAAEWLEPEDARRLEPALTTKVLAALLLPRDERIDSRRLTRSLWKAAAAAGVRFRLGEPAAGVRTEGGLATGVALAGGGAVPAAVTVLAAGCWSGELAGLPRPLPVFPVRGQMAAAELVPPPFRRVLLGAGCYLIPRRDGRVVIGSTMERVGFEDRPTAGGIRDLLGSAIALAPTLAGAPLVETWAGLRPATPDGLPVLGRDPEADGLIYATGHFRNGVLLAPVTAQAVADLITAGDAPFPLSAFRPDRFAAAETPE